MAQETGISWCDATWNPWWGCWPVSPGCALCYADREASRHGYDQLWEKEGPRRTFGEKHWNEPRVWARNLPRKLGRRPRAFCASMADIGEDHPVAERERPKLWRLIESTPQLDWLLLTKRVDTAAHWLPERWLAGGFPLNVWFGFSAEDQARYEERIVWAMALGAPITFCSYEPALGPVDFGLGPQCTAYRLDWIIAGGESAVPAKRARPSHPDWFRSARDQAISAGVPFHFKQWGEWAPVPVRYAGSRPTRCVYGEEVHISDEEAANGLRQHLRNPATVHLIGRKSAGRHLDGRTWDEFPVSPAETA